MEYFISNSVAFSLDSVITIPVPGWSLFNIQFELLNVVWRLCGSRFKLAFNCVSSFAEMSWHGS